MGATASEALRHALMLFANPALVEPHRRAPVPDGMGELLRAACGQGELLEQQAALLGMPADKIEEAARFYVEQMLLSREVASNPWRVLGAEPGTPPERLREHRQLLLRLVHPDRSSDWAEAYADRVQRAWRELKNGGPAPEPRADAGAPESDDWEVPSPSPSAWQPVAPHPLSVEEPPHHETMSSRSKWGLAGFGVLLLGLLLWGPQLEEALRGDDLQVLGGYAVPDDQAGEVAETSSDPPGSAEDRAPESSDNAPLATSALAYPDPMVDALPVAPAESARPAATRAPPSDRPAAPSSTPAAGELDGQQVAASSAPVPERAPNVADTRGASPATGPRDRDEAVAGSADIASTAPRRSEGVESARLGTRDTDRDPAAGRAGTQLVASTSLSPAEGPTAQARAKDRAGEAGATLANAAPRASQQAASSRDASAGSPSPRADVPSAVVSTAASTSAPASTPTSVPAAPSRPSLAQADATLGHFKRHYAAGDLGALLKLFADNANAKRGGVPALRADYSALFGSTDSREIEFIDVRWQVVRDSLQGHGRFEVRLGRKGRLFRQKVSGRVNLEVVQTASGPRLNRLEPIQGG